MDSDAITSFEKEAAEKSVAALSAPVHDEDGNFEHTGMTILLSLTPRPATFAEGQELQTLGGVTTAAGFKTVVEGAATEPDASQYGMYAPGIPDLARGALASAGASLIWPCS